MTKMMVKTTMMISWPKEVSSSYKRKQGTTRIRFKETIPLLPLKTTYRP